MLNVLMIASTELRNANKLAEILPFQPSASDGEYLTEFAGRGCYQSWSRPNSETAVTRDYVRKNILGKGHESVLEHTSVTFYIQGVSRSLTHELIRHRHLSFSELSQRYVPMEGVRYVLPPLVRETMAEVSKTHPEGEGWTPEVEENTWNNSDLYGMVADAYHDVAEVFTQAHEEYNTRIPSNKERREAQRAVLPNATETKLTVTGNLRAWRHVIKLRGSLHADAEIRELAVELYRQLSDEHPSVFADMALAHAADGREYICELTLEPAELDNDRPVREWSVKHTGLVGDTND